MKKDFEKIPDTQALEWISQVDIAHLLSDTDLAITRGSATTLAEIDIFGVRKIIIPLPYAADNHQYWNAKEYEKASDILIEQKDI
jgi:UDP-N-acetylglucosamine--N-acetylmuramyl-(pentapeptide) pyrophosphoryl-undecaprenol N-acetylglucosamine transferase